MDKKGGLIVADAEALGRTVSELLGDEARRQNMSMAAFDVVAANQGALERTLTALQPLLKEASGRRQ